MGQKNTANFDAFGAPQAKNQGIVTVVVVVVVAVAVAVVVVVNVLLLEDTKNEPPWKQPEIALKTR